MTSRVSSMYRWIFAAIIVLIAVIGPVRFSWFSVCSRCGCIQHSTSRQLPFLPISYWTSNDIEQTHLSRKIAAFVPPHAHKWQFGHGSGNGVYCAIGPGRHTRISTSSEQVAAFIVATQTHRGDAESLYWLSQAMDENRCRALRNWLLINEFPEDSPPRESYEAWRLNADETLPEYESLKAFSAMNVGQGFQTRIVSSC